MRADRHPPLSFLAFREWVALFGQSDAAVRALPALVSCITLVLFAACVRRIAAAPTALLATTLHAVSPYQVWIAQEARMYPLVELGAVLVLLGGEHARERRVLVVGLACVGTWLAFVSHDLGVCVAGLTLASGLSWRERRHAALGVAIGTIAWPPWLLAALREQMQSSWGDTVKLSWSDVAELAPRLLAVEMDAVPEVGRPAAYALGLLCWLALAHCGWLARRDRVDPHRI